jgi:Asp-tRNA(Asn)/Glu-tRNA(Gln) amidotransferase A subunit family amidase
MTLRLALALFALAMPQPALAAPCPLPGQKPMLLVKMYFGQGSDARAWDRFLADTVTPRFPDGFTVYDARGQWMDPKTHRLTREASKVIEIAAPDTSMVRARVGDIARDYRAKFKQQSVGIVTTAACAAF